MNLRIPLLNGQGLISKCVNKLKNKELFSFFFQNNDIILFTEARISDISDLIVGGFESFPLQKKLLNLKASIILDAVHLISALMQ